MGRREARDDRGYDLCAGIALLCGPNLAHRSRGLLARRTSGTTFSRHSVTGTCTPNTLTWPLHRFGDASNDVGPDTRRYSASFQSLCSARGLGRRGALQQLGEFRALRALIRQRYGGKITLDLYEAKLLDGVQLRGNTLILSDDRWLLRVVGSTCGVGQETERELHALMSRSFEYSRNPRLEKEALSAIVEVSAAC